MHSLYTKIYKYRVLVTYSRPLYNKTVTNKLESSLKYLNI